jgi:hypothetical protein
MKYGILTSILICFSLTMPTIQAESSSIGIGVGHLYSGIGINYNKHRNNHLTYGSLGCIAVAHSGNSGIETECGVGAGHIMTNLFMETDKHGFGLYTGVYRNTDKDANEVIFGPTYTFFSNGMGNPGWSIGVMPYLRKISNQDTDYKVLFNLGYQF